MPSVSSKTQKKINTRYTIYMRCKRKTFYHNPFWTNTEMPYSFMAKGAAIIISGEGGGGAGVFAWPFFYFTREMESFIFSQISPIFLTNFKLPTNFPNLNFTHFPHK